MLIAVFGEQQVVQFNWTFGFVKKVVRQNMVPQPGNGGTEYIAVEFDSRL